MRQCLNEQKLLQRQSAGSVGKDSQAATCYNFNMRKIPDGVFLATKSKRKTPLALSSLSAGEPSEICEDYELLDINELITGGKEGIVSYHVTGDSMREDIKPGDVVFADPYRQPENGDVIVSRINGKNNIKIYKSNSNKLFLVSKNKAYPAREVTAIDDFHILGVVLAHIGFHKK